MIGLGGFVAAANLADCETEKGEGERNTKTKTKAKAKKRVRLEIERKVEGAVAFSRTVVMPLQRGNCSDVAPTRARDHLLGPSPSFPPVSLRRLVVVTSEESTMAVSPMAPAWSGGREEGRKGEEGRIRVID